MKIPYGTIRKCAVCEKEIEVKLEHIGTTHRSSEESVRGFARHGCRSFIVSDEGVMFDLHNKKYGAGIWFCNNCWNLVTEKVKLGGKHGKKK